MNRIALITGASSGIGLELAHIHAQTGNDVVIVARRKDLLDELKNTLEKKYAIKAYVIVKDLTLPHASKSLYDEVKALNLNISYLMNNAGFGGQGLFHEQSLDFSLNMMQLNMVALTELTYYFIPDFIQQGYGKILNTSSIASLMAGPLQAVYYASKAYVQSFSLALASELNDSKITVTALMPGPINTGFEKTARLEKTSMYKKAYLASDVARVGYQAMLKGKLKVITGISFRIWLSIKMTPFLPDNAKLNVIKKMHQNK